MQLRLVAAAYVLLMLMIVGVSTPSMAALPPPDFAGTLEKYGGGKVFSRNQSRFFELRGTHLYYYKAKPAAGDQPAGCVELVDTKIIDNPKEKFSFEIKGPKLKKDYVLYAASETEKKQWMERLMNPKRGSGQLLATTGDDDDDNPTGTDNAGRMYFSNKAGKKVSAEDFEIVRVIGKGSFGKVMEVKKKDTNETFAMKEMSKEVIERENLLEHIFAEKSILQKIDHPFVVQLHYAFQTKDKLYLILDFLSGGELFFHLTRDQKFDEWRSKFYTAEIGLALGHLHDLDIISPYTTPKNAVLDRDGHVCLTDFGLAKTNVQGAYAASTFCGTPEYLAPEFLMGSGHGKAVDWWSLGILLYEMLCGLPPFYDESVNRMYELILTKALEFPDDVSPAARDLCAKLLDRNPETRLKDVKAFKAHPFFSGLNWDDVYHRRIKTPFKPDSNAESNFDPEFTSLHPRLSIASNPQNHTQIPGFTYQGKESDLQ
jgi:serine/threonine protein kinase